jgi:hypothetical protein
MVFIDDGVPESVQLIDIVVILQGESVATCVTLRVLLVQSAQAM